MTRLRKMMLEDLQRRDYSQHTIRCYLRAVEDFSRRFNRPPDCLGPWHIREYQAELLQEQKLSPGTVTTRLAALRFFYVKTLKKAWNIQETPYPKKRHRLPTILSPEEVAQLIDAAHTPYQRILLMTLYATGVRRTVLARLKVSDIESTRRLVDIKTSSGPLHSRAPCRPILRSSVHRAGIVQDSPKVKRSFLQPSAKPLERNRDLHPCCPYLLGKRGSAPKFSLRNKSRGGRNGRCKRRLLAGRVEQRVLRR